MRQKQATLDGYERIKSLARTYHYDVSLRLDKDFDFEGRNSLVELMGESLSRKEGLVSNKKTVADFEPDFDNYMGGMQNSQVTSAKELAAWNKAHADLVLPSGMKIQRHNILFTVNAQHVRQSTRTRNSSNAP